MNPFDLSQHVARSPVNVVDWPYDATADGAIDDTAAFQTAINALAPTGGVVVVPGAGDYDLAVGGLGFAAKRVRWELPQGATINGATFAEIPGEWVRPEATVWFVAGGDAAAFQIGLNYRTLLQAGALGHFEAAHVECDARAYGTGGKFIVGLNAIGNTSSNGNVFGVNAVGAAQAAAAAGTEVSGAEVNTDVRCAAVVRKTGLQIVDISTSIGVGSVHDAAIWIAKQGAGAAGYKNGVQIGAGTDADFPLSAGAALLHGSIATLGAKTIGYGFRAGYLSYSNAAVQLQANAPGHVIGWAAGAGSGLGAGMVASICTVDNGGAVIFNAGGIVFQANTMGGGARFTGLELVSDGTNPVKIVAGGLARQVQVGAVDSGGSGFRMLRVAN
jgi:hypothetical protein